MFDKINIAKQKIKNGEPILVAGLSIPDSGVAELMAMSGIDLIMVDHEHMCFDDKTLLDVCRAITAHGKAAVLRTSIKDEEILMRYMQFGFSGICGTMCGGVEDAKKVVKAVKYPNDGERGLSNDCRATAFGTYGGKSIKEYMEWRNEDSIVMITLESKPAVEEAVAIAELTGVDMVHIGPVDLAASMGYYGNPRNDEIRQMLSVTNGKLAAMGNYNSYFAEKAEDIPALLERGAKCIFVPSDIHLLRDALGKYGKTMQEAAGK